MGSNPPLTYTMLQFNRGLVGFDAEQTWFSKISRLHLLLKGSHNVPVLWEIFILWMHVSTFRTLQSLVSFLLIDAYGETSLKIVY